MARPQFPTIKKFEKIWRRKCWGEKKLIKGIITQEYHCNCQYIGGPKEEFHFIDDNH